jgi:tetratricopeptide (TPR) repeat protein
MARLTLALVLLASVAQADDKAGAQAEMVKAQENLNRGEFEAAIGHFDLARSLAPSSSGPYLGLGLAYARSGRCEQAIPHLEEYLRRKQQNPKPEAAGTLEDCRKRAARAMGRVVVTSDPSGAEVRFDDAEGPPLGTTPFESQPLPPGRHRVFVAKSGFRSASSEVAVNAGERSTFTVALVAEATPRVVAPEKPRIAIPPAPPEPIVPGRLIVDAPADAHIWLNGNEVATRHYEGPQVAGEYRILVEKDGHRSVSTTVKLSAGATERRELKLQPLKKNAWLGVGIGFTVVAAAMGAGALATYVVGNDKPRDTDDYQNNKTATLAMQGIFYPTLAVAAAGYIVWGVVNRGRISDGPPLSVQATPAGFTF